MSDDEGRDHWMTWYVPPRKDEPVAEPWSAPDGTRWIYSPGLNIFTGWVPGEDGCWTRDPDEFRRTYPDAPDPLQPAENGEGTTPAS